MDAFHSNSCSSLSQSLSSSSASSTSSDSSSASSDMLHQSPRRISTGNAKIKGKQQELINLIEEELGSQTWHFPPDVFVKMISPKTPRKKNPEECLYIEDFICDSDKTPFKDACEVAVSLVEENYRGPGSATWITETDENAHYDQVVDLFNDILKACRTALKDSQDTLFQDVEFFNMHDSKMMNKAIGSYVLRADIIMEEKEEWPVGTGETRSDRFRWCKQEAGQCQAMLVCEVESDWRRLIAQLGTYARSQFDAFPSRFFVLTIAFDHIKESARFVVFHRSGITASHLMALTNISEREKVVRIFMAFMIWKNASDAGLPDFNDNVAYKLVNSSWDITQRLYHTSCVRGRATTVVRVERKDGNENSTEFPAIPLLPRSRVHNPKKRASEDEDNTVKNRRATGWKSGASNEDNSDHRAESLIVQGNLCLPIRARAHPPGHFLQTHNGEDAKDSDAPAKQRIIKDYCPFQSRANVEKEALGNLHNAFGVANIRVTYCAQASNGQLQATSIFLPRPEVARDFHFFVFGEYVNPPEPRTRLLIEMTSIGKSLVDCKPGKDLMTKVAHSMLGWFNVYQNGFLHRDVSIGNVLAFEEGEERLPFNLTEEFRESLGKVTDAELKTKCRTLGIPLKFRMLIPDALDLAEKLELLLKENGVGSFCEAFITDGDMAKNWKDIFRNWRKEKEVAIHERSGTEFFMSTTLLNPLRRNYVQSPIDDIESFLWVTLWAILKNNVEKATGDIEWYGRWYEGGDRRGALHEYRKLNLDEDVLPELLREWTTCLEDLSTRYEWTVGYLTKICNKNGWDSEEEEAQYWKAVWHGYALEGVFRSLSIIFKYMESLVE